MEVENPRDDVLADVLGIAMLRNVLYKRVDARAPWGIRLASRERAFFYLLMRGAGRLEVQGEAPIELSAGEFAFIPHGTPHVFRDNQSTTPVEAHDASRCSAPGPRRLGGDGAQTLFMSGFFELGNGTPPALLASLPKVVALRPSDPTTTPWLAATLQLMVSEASNPGPASVLVMQRLCDVLFVQALRALTTESHRCHYRGLAALSDTPMRNALSLLHQDPAEPWTVASLAKRVGMSRSAFAARFTELVGESPLEYLARWRMTRAAELLRDTDEAISVVAERVGYDSVPSFSRAFTRHRRERPGAFRKSSRERAHIDATALPSKG